MPSSTAARGQVGEAGSLIFVAIFEAAINAEPTTKRWQPRGLTLQEPPEYDAVARQKRVSDMLGCVLLVFS